ncbi:MAG: hypothetical protein ACOX9C_04430 [Kiritimatiellia bacterium]|jgi:hypothetical protein
MNGMIDCVNTDPAALLAHLERAIAEGFAAPRGATVAVADDPAHAMDLLAAGRPGGLAIVLFYLGDAAAGMEELPEDTLVSGQIRAACAQSPGLAARPGRGAPGALAAAGELRTFVRRIADAPTLSGGYDYAGMQHLAARSGELLHGYALAFHAHYADRA